MFKEGFLNFFKTRMNLSQEPIDSVIQLAKTASRSYSTRKTIGCFCTALVVGSDDVASSYSIGVLTRRQVGRREGSRGAREVANY